MFSASGTLGVLQVGYQRSVEFRNWSLTCDFDAINTQTWKLRARVTKRDKYWSTIAPDTIRLQMEAQAWWVWHEIIDVALSDVDLDIIFRGSPDIHTR